MSEFKPIDWDAAYREAFADVYRGLVATLLDRELALEGLQEAFLEGIRRPPRTEDNLRGWLFRVALRSARRSARRLLSSHARSSDGVTSDELGALLDRLRVGQLLRMLTERQRGMVVAYYWFGFSQEDIAVAFGVRRGTVGATISQALVRMRTEARHG